MKYRVTSACVVSSRGKPAQLSVTLIAVTAWLTWFSTSPLVCHGQTGGGRPARTIPADPQLFLTEVFEDEAPPLIGIAPPVIESDGPTTEPSPVATADGASETAPIDPAVEQAIADAVAAALAEQKPDEPEEEEEPPFAVSGGNWTVKLGGHVQLDYINWADASDSIPDTKNYFEFRRLRLVGEGTGYEVYDFRLQMTLEPETVGESPVGTITSPDVKDAYFSINEIPWIGRARIGNFFVPFGLEQVTNDTNNNFLERSIPTQGVFSADREVGIAMYNCTEDKRITWASGVFFDSISEGLKERLDDNQGYRISGRLTGLPVYEDEGRYLVHVGAGVLFTDDQDNRVRFRTRPQIHEGPRIIDSGVLFADSTATGNLEGAIVWGPVALQSEVFLCNVNMTAGGDDTVHGGYAHLSYFLTGENRKFDMFGQHGAQFGRNVPNTNVFATDCEHGAGAWELKARYSHLNLNNVAAGEYNDMTFGFNWYWSDRVRVMFDWIHPVTTNDAIFGATKSDILGMRYDFNW